MRELGHTISGTVALIKALECIARQAAVGCRRTKSKHRPSTIDLLNDADLPEYSLPLGLTWCLWLEHEGPTLVGGINSFRCRIADSNAADHNDCHFTSMLCRDDAVRVREATNVILANQTVFTATICPLANLASYGDGDILAHRGDFLAASEARMRAFTKRSMSNSACSNWLSSSRAASFSGLFRFHLGGRLARLGASSSSALARTRWRASRVQMATDSGNGGRSTRFITRLRFLSNSRSSL